MEMNLAKEIADLLYYHDCVIVPDFGGFLGQYRSAQLQRERKRILPPGKEISFNRELTRNDGLLTDRIAAENDLAYQDSLKSIQKHVNQWEKEIAEHGRLELKNIGVFIQNSDGQLLFEPDRHANYATHAFGLKATSAVPVDRELKIGKEVRVIQLPIEAPVSEEEPKKNGTLLYWSAAAAAAFILTAGTLAFIGQETSSNGQLGNLWPFAPQENRNYEPRELIKFDAPEAEEGFKELTVDELGEGINEIALIDDKSPKHFVWKEREVSSVVAESTDVATVSHTGRYHVIIGCFGVEENALELVNKLNLDGVSARVLDQHRGLFRVAYDSYSKKQSALLGLKEARRSGKDDAWLLIK